MTPAEWNMRGWAVGAEFYGMALDIARFNRRLGRVIESIIEVPERKAVRELQDDLRMLYDAFMDLSQVYDADCGAVHCPYPRKCKFMSERACRQMRAAGKFVPKCPFWAGR